MQNSRLISRINPKAASTGSALGLADLVAQHDSSADFLREAVEKLIGPLQIASLSVYRGERGRWRLLANAGEKLAAPDQLLADCLDSERPRQQGRFLAAPLDPANSRGELLVAMSTSAVTEQMLLDFDAAAALLELYYRLAREKEQRERKVRRNHEILQIAMQWNKTNDSEKLFHDIAEASTRLLGTERASIFLWNRPKKELVAHPALGVEKEELRIPDDVGVVGQVIQTREPRRVDADVREQQEEIDRQVDKQLHFKTKSLLCVPMIGRDGKLLGAFEMINKIAGNFTDADEEALIELAAHACVALENSQHLENVLAKKKRMADQAAEGVQLIGNSPAIEKLRNTIQRVAHTDLAILVLGENGTGKEVVSRLIHYLSERRNEPLVAVNCAAISETLLESELFGHEKGAFTDAREARAGKFELASGGTLFLDEIGDMSPGGQSKLLRVLEEKVVVRVGGSVPISTDVRVCAATNQDLSELVKQRRFREDLFFRLNVVTLVIPPLRERGEDVILLAEEFLKDFCLKARRPTLSISAAAKKRLLAHSWPGNVRELRNMMERLAYLSQEDKIDADDLSFAHGASESKPEISLDHSLNDATREFQIEFINRQIAAAGGNMTDAAKKLGLHRSNLYRKMRQLGMDSPPEEENA